MGNSPILKPPSIRCERFEHFCHRLSVGLRGEPQFALTKSSNRSRWGLRSDVSQLPSKNVSFRLKLRMSRINGNASRACRLRIVNERQDNTVQPTRARHDSHYSNAKKQAVHKCCITHNYARRASFPCSVLYHEGPRLASRPRVLALAFQLSLTRRS